MALIRDALLLGITVHTLSAKKGFPFPFSITFKRSVVPEKKKEMKGNKKMKEWRKKRKLSDTHFRMRKKGVAGWWSCHWQSDSGWLASPGAVEEAEGALALGCSAEEGAEAEEVGEGSIRLWCHSPSCGRGFP